MQKLIVFNNVTLDGYFAGENGDFSWAHGGPADDEFNAFVAGNASGDGTLLFGRITYEMMAGYWPTPAAAENDPAVAEGMNRMSKLVVSSSLDKATWKNTRVLKGELAKEIRKIKQEPGEGVVILGSGSVVSQLASEQLIDEYHVVIHPVVLGNGRTMFNDMKKKLNLKLINSRVFNSGKVYLRYDPSA